MARFGEKEVAALLQDAGIVRHRKKIESTINNAQRAIALQKECGSLAEYFWGYEPQHSERPPVIDYAAVGKLAKTPTSTALSKD